MGTVRYVVAEGDDPHLAQVRFVQERCKERQTRVVRMLEYGDVIAVRPSAVPSTTVSELQARVGRGLDRLV